MSHTNNSAQRVARAVSARAKSNILAAADEILSADDSADAERAYLRALAALKIAALADSVNVS
jgi:hypothetical protein